MQRRPYILATVLVLLAVLGVGAAVLVADDDEVGSGATQSTTTTLAVTTTSTTAPTTTSTADTSTTSTTSVTPALPAVTGVTAGPGGGSGEIALRWDAVAGATGYRVLRSETSAGPFTVSATIDVTDGSATAGEGVVNIFSAAHAYVPDGPALNAPDPSPSFDYVELATGNRCFQVVAVDGDREATPSATACAAPA